MQICTVVGVGGSDYQIELIIRWGESDQPVLSDHPCNTESVIIDTGNGDYLGDEMTMVITMMPRMTRMMTRMIDDYYKDDQDDWDNDNRND